MKLEDQVCTIEQAKKLKKLGVKQKSLFYWKENNIQTVVSERQMKLYIKKYPLSCNEYYSAFTVGELVRMNVNCGGIQIDDGEAKYYSRIGYQKYEEYNNFAQACASKLIRSIEKNWILIDKVNNRLEL